jgi:hypothetical protein
MSTSKNYLARITPLSETKKITLEILSDYKTIASKKAYMTRAIKQTESFLNDVKEATNGNGWLHGEIYTLHHVRCINTELQMIKRMREEIKG